MALLNIINGLWWACFIYLGLKTSLSDLKDGKIKNKDIALMIAASVAFCFAWSFSASIEFGIGFFSVFARFFYHQAISFILGILLGVAFWFLGLWPPGDAKLFAAYCFLIPVGMVRYGQFPFFVNFFINITVITAFVILLKKIKRFRFEKSTFTWKAMLITLTGVFSITWIIEIISRLFQIELGMVGFVFFMFAIFAIMNKVLKVSASYFFIGISLLRLLLDYPNYFDWGTLFSLFQLWFFLVVIRMVLVDFNFIINTKKVRIEDLKENMLLAQVPVKVKGKVIMKPRKQFAFYQYLMTKFNVEDSGKPVFDYDPTFGLTAGQIKQLKSLAERKGIQHILVFRTIFFAPIIFFAAIASIIARGSIFYFFGWHFAFLLEAIGNILRVIF
jgi:hypothetical protein